MRNRYNGPAINYCWSFFRRLFSFWSRYFLNHMGICGVSSELREND